jgi:hypothetical protein
MPLKATNKALINVKSAFSTSNYTTDPSKRAKLEIDYYIPYRLEYIEKIINKYCKRLSKQYNI